MIEDRLNPIVVKELRQGLKSRSFIATFIGLQGAMVLSMFIYLAAASADGSDLTFADGFFWFMLGLMLLLFMPLRAFQALHEEVKGNTLELLFLTRMTAWHISVGKWLALVIQILLLVSAVLPYLVLRYFIGSIDVTANLQVLGVQVLMSMLLVSGGVGLSAWKSRLVRGLVTVGALFAMYVAMMGMFSFSSFGGGGPFAYVDWTDVLLWLVVAALVMMFFVEYGASQIAPPAENHSRPKRLLAMGLALAFSAYSLWAADEPEPMFVCVVMLLPVFADALCEPLVGIPSLYRRGRTPVLRWLLFPGWASGFLFTVMMLAFTFLITAITDDLDADIGIVFLVIFNTLLLPFVLIRLIPLLARKALPAYFGMQIFCFLTCLMFVFLWEIDLVSNSEFEFLGNLLPMLGLFVMADGGPEDLHGPLLLVPALLFLSIGLFRVSRPLARMRELANRA